MTISNDDDDTMQMTLTVTKQPKVMHKDEAREETQMTTGQVRMTMTTTMAIPMMMTMTRMRVTI